MTIIQLTTTINAPKEIVFDVSRDLDIHQLSTAKTKEKIIAGRKSGLIEKGETVTWKAKHFGVWLTHKSIISEMDFPNSFVDEMLESNFKSFRHEHRFESENECTIMTDTISYETPLGIFGKWFDRLILKYYLTNFIAERNSMLKKVAESHNQFDKNTIPNHKTGISSTQKEV